VRDDLEGMKWEGQLVEELCANSISKGIKIRRKGEK